MISYDRPAMHHAFQAISERKNSRLRRWRFQASVALVRLGFCVRWRMPAEHGADAGTSETPRSPSYGVSVLLDMGLSIGLVWQATAVT